MAKVARSKEYRGRQSLNERKETFFTLGYSIVDASVGCNINFTIQDEVLPVPWTV